MQDNRGCIIQVEVYPCLLLSISCSVCILLGLHLLAGSFLLGHLFFIFLLLLLHTWACKLSARVWALLPIFLLPCYSNASPRQHLTRVSSHVTKFDQDLSHAVQISTLPRQAYSNTNCHAEDVVGYTRRTFAAKMASCVRMSYLAKEARPATPASVWHGHAAFVKSLLTMLH